MVDHVVYPSFQIQTVPYSIAYIPGWIELLSIREPFRIKGQYWNNHAKDFEVVQRPSSHFRKWVRLKHKTVHVTPWCCPHQLKQNPKEVLSHRLNAARSHQRTVVVAFPQDTEDPPLRNRDMVACPWAETPVLGSTLCQRIDQHVYPARWEWQRYRLRLCQHLGLS